MLTRGLWSGRLHTMNSDIKQFSFDGAEFPITRTRTPGGWGIAIADVCNHLGISSQSQYQRLRRTVWAQNFIEKIWFRGQADLQRREFFVLDVKRFPMWLATIDISRVRNDSARAKIEHWQREAAEALEELVFTDPGSLRISPLTGHVYAILFSNGVVKVGATSNPSQRMDTYRQDCLRYGVMMDSAWLSPMLMDPFDAEDTALRWCSDQGSLVQGRESFKIDYANLLSYLTDVLGEGTMWS